MSRIAPLHAHDVAPSIQEVTAQAEERLPQFMNQILTLAHHPAIAHDLVTMYLGFQENSVVDKQLIELAILTVSYLNRCTYCISHHRPLGLEAGLSALALDALTSDAVLESEHFSDVEKLVIAYAQQITKDARRVSDALFEQLSRHFDNAQIVELTVRIGLANFFNRLNDALQIEIEPGVGLL